MRNQNLRRRLAAIESRFDGTPVRLKELRDLIIFAPAEVLENAIIECASRMSSADAKGSVETNRCPQCGYSGSFSERRIDSNGFAEIPAAPKRAPTTVTELERAIERSRPGLLDDAMILSLVECDPTIELIAIDCPRCRHQSLSTGAVGEIR